jgi:hypothetical protein
MRTFTKIAATLGVVETIALPSGSATAITTTTMAAAHGMGARLIGPSRAASVSRIAMVRGTMVDPDGGGIANGA